MEPLDIEDTRASAHIQANANKVPTFRNESNVILFAFATSLGFLSIGYHLSATNSSGAFVWDGMETDQNFFYFRTFGDSILALSAFLTAGFLSFNKIKFRHFMKLLVFADVLMSLGTVMCFAVLNNEPGTIYWGKVIVGLAIGINATVILSFVREGQFYLSESNFKPEKRRFFAELLFSFGVFLGVVPSQLFSEVANYNDHSPIQELVDEYGESNQALDFTDLGTTVTHDMLTCYMLAFIPVTASIARVLLFIYIGNVKPPQYAPAFTDEGLTEDYDAEGEEGKLYMIKFKETRSMFKLLEEPYRRRVELCYILHFLQIVSGIVVFLVNPQFLAAFINSHYAEDPSSTDIQFTILGIVSIYLLTSVLISLLLTVVKVPRRLIMAAGNLLSTMIALALGVLSIMDNKSYMRMLLFLYWFFICIGMGPIVELFIEEVLPAKGMQFLQSVKWLLISVIGFLTKYSLQYDIAYTPLYFFFLTIGIMTLFVVYDLMPETADVQPNDIYKLFEFEDEQEVPQEPVEPTSRTFTFPHEPEQAAAQGDDK